MSIIFVVTMHGFKSHLLRINRIKPVHIKILFFSQKGIIILIHILNKWNYSFKSFSKGNFRFIIFTILQLQLFPPYYKSAADEFETFLDKKYGNLHK